MVIDIELFSEEHAASIANRLESLRSQWICRNEGFSTFGVATYLDLMSSKSPEMDYYDRSQRYNQLLMEHFSDELEIVRKSIADYFNTEARFEPALALPGFHIFEYHGITISDQPSHHFDLQHRYLRWPFAPISDDVISFTLALKIPRLGAALEYWNFDEADIRRLEKMGRVGNIQQFGARKPPMRHNYKPGHMAVQLRPILHRIGSIADRFPGDQRITLQGHGVRDKKNWVLYW
jgi:hypothetical protein